MTPRAAPPLGQAETTIAAIEEETARGPVWLARAVYPAHFRHGRAALQAASDFRPAHLALVARERDASAVDATGWMVLDVETTGLGARAGTYAFLIGIGAWVDGAFVIEQLLMRDPDDEPALLAATAARLQRAAGILTFNGKCFDMPLLATRFAVARQPPPVPPRPHCDLLHAARRLWSRTTGDCCLAALECRLLGVRRSHDVAGRDVPERYLDYLRRGDAEPLDAVLRHNRADLLSLALLAAEAARAPVRAQQSGDAGGEAALERVRVARLFADAGAEAEAATLFASCLSAAAPTSARQTARGWLARERQRRGDLAAACALWQAMLEEEPHLVEPYAALAKTLEHRLRDPARALSWVDERLAGATLAAADAADLAHRRARLARKLGALAPAWIDTVSAEVAPSIAFPSTSLDRGTRSLLPYASPESKWCPPSLGHHVEANDP